MDESLRKTLTIASSVAALVVWLNEQFHLLSDKVATWLSVGVAGTQLLLAIA